jgi:hypothetical protein
LLAFGNWFTSPIASPNIKTRVWSTIELGEVRKKKARVTWKRERDVMIVDAEITAILLVIVCDVQDSLIIVNPLD